MTQSGGDNVNGYKSEGNAAYQKGDYDAAIGLYTKAIETDQNNALLYNNRAAAYLMLKKYLDAFNDSKKSIQLDPAYPKALLRYLKCCVNMGMVEEARSICTTLRELDPTMHNELSNQLHQIDLLQQTYVNYEKQLAVPDLSYALHLITKCTELSPGSLEFGLKKIRLLIDMKRFTEAKQRVEILLQIAGASVDVLYYRGLCLFYLDHLDKAVSHFQHVLRCHPDHVQTQQTFKRAKTLLRLKDEGNTYIQQRRFSRAKEAYTEALTVDPLHDAINSKLYCNRAYAQYNLENYDDALEDCNKAIAIDPTYVKAYIRRAKCYSALEMYDKAVEEWSEVMKREPTSEYKQGLQHAKRELARSKEVNYYKVLGLKKNASFNEIKQAYKKRALEHHPDRHHDADEQTKLEQERKFKTIGEAYSVLSDPQKRQQYDDGVFSPSGTNQPDVHTMFSQMFPGHSYQFKFS